MSEVPVLELPPDDKENGESGNKKEEPVVTVDPREADKMAEKEFKSKYPSFGNRPSGMAKRKISAAGGKQYFDSGEYNKSASKKERQQMSSLPHAINPHKSTHSQPSGIPPHLAHMRAKPKAPLPSNLAGPAKTPLSD